MTRSHVAWMSLLALAGATSPGSAQEHFDVSLFAGATVFLRDLADPSEVDRLRNENAAAFGARLVWGGERFGLEGTVAVIPTEVDLGSGQPRPDQAVVAVSVEGTAGLPGHVLEPFIAVGLGDKHYRKPGPASGGERGWSSGVYLLISAGAGVRLHLSEAVHLRLDVRDLISEFDTSQRRRAPAIPWTQHDLMMTLGLGYRLGLD